jgi:tetratricopeptide (TPR) repeat protein
VSAELIFRRGTPPDAEYTFKHALVQDAAYGTLLRSRRKQIHARITATLEDQFPEIVETQPELLARHCAEAGLADKAVGYLVQAGKQAISRCAMTEAVAQLRRGLERLPDMPEGDARYEQELDLQITLGNALIATEGYSAPQAGEAFARARELCAQLDRSRQLGPVLVGQFQFRIIRGELEQAEYHANEIRHLGETLNDPMWKYAGSGYSGGLCFYLGKFIDSRIYFENSLLVWDPTYRAFHAEDMYSASLGHLFRTLLCLGYIDQARLRRDEALAEARRLSAYNLAYALCQAWFGVWAMEGVKSVEIMLGWAEEVLAISREHGFPLFLGVGNVMRGRCLGGLGQPTEGIKLILQGIDTWRATGAKLVLPFFLTTMAEVHGNAGQLEEGLKRLAEAGKLVERTQERWAESEMHRLRGTFLLSLHEHAAAEDSLRKALAVARRQSAKFWELRAALDLARLWRDQGKRGEALDLLAPV